MKVTPNSNLDQLFISHQEFFNSRKTIPYSFRIEQLKVLEKAIKKYEEKIEEALWLDLHKSSEEAYLTEISIVKAELSYHKRKLKRWMKPKRVPTPMHLLPSRSSIHQEPLGTALIVSPWNYPFQLLINPLVGAISAGCCAMIKPSPDAPHFAEVIDEMITEFFDPSYISVVHGEKETNTHLFSMKFDIIFFTGSPMLGRVVMKAAAKHLTPVVLELGGKSPCIVDESANLEIAAKRISWGKFINAGQTCIAPDYLMVHEKVKDELIQLMIENIKKVYGENPMENHYYPRIIHQRAIDRLKNLIEGENVIYGGEIDEGQRYISPTLIELKSTDTAIMQEEIFGPLLPFMTFSNLDEATAFINSKEKPLALYYFGNNQKAKQVLNNTTSGGGCINDTLLHVGNHHLPFGGVGNSGLGNYHGKLSFEAFSNPRAIVNTPTWIDIPLKYPPFKNFHWLRKFI